MKFSIIILLLFVSAIPFAYAQHHGGQQAPPISFGDGQLTVATSIFPTDFTAGKNSSLDLIIRLFDTASNQNIENVTYRVQIFHESDLVANQMFFDKDGELNIKIKPKSNCEQKDMWKCTTYYGESDPIVPNALVSSFSSVPVITGPVFDKSGSYTVKTAIIGAQNPKTQTSEDIEFETTIFVPSENIFKISFNGNEYQIPVKNYQDPVTNFIFDSQTKTISFDIPFDWEHVEHTYHLKNTLQIPKGFLAFQNVYGFTTSVNDETELKPIIHFDTISQKDSNIFHFMVDQNSLKQIKERSDFISVKITPGSDSSFKEKIINFDSEYSAKIIYDSMYSTEKYFVMSIAFFKNGELLPDVRYGYSIKDPMGMENFNTGGNPNLLGIHIPDGFETREFGQSHLGEYQMQLVLIGQGSSDFPRYKYSEFSLNIDSTLLETPKTSGVPDWIKNNAKWWAEGSIDDSSFTKGIEFLIKEKIINVGSKSINSNTSSEIPNWIKNNAKWWAEGSIDENSFISGIEFLVKEGIISVN